MLSFVQGLKLPFKRKPLQFSVPKEPLWSTSEQVNIESCIRELLRSGAVSTVTPCSSQYLSKIFLVPKSDGRHRLILNLKSLNKFLWAPHFKLEDHRTVTKILTRGCWMATLDLKDAYFLVPIFPSHRKYLRFQFMGKLYGFNCLPFGLNCAPYVFTKLMKPVLSYLRNMGYLSVLYLDDFLLVGISKQDCTANINSTIKILQTLGFIINYNKSNLVPSHCVTYLGFIYNSLDLSVSLPTNKISKVIEYLQKFSALQTCRIIDFAKFLGTLTAVCPAVRYGWLYTKVFERQKFLALKASGGNYDAKMSLPGILQPDFQWWLRNISTAKNNIRIDSYSLEISSDASTTGWGASANGKKCHGYWSETERSYHINFLELKAAFLALCHFADGMRNCNILCRVDNTTALAYINKMGSVQYPDLNNLSRIIWQWCEKRNIFLFASYISSSENFIADAESRIKLSHETEWELHDTFFQKIVSKLGQPDIDLFATRLNTKCRVFVSWLREPQCFAVDAFTLDWKEYFFYAFPPFILILRVLHKIIEDRACGIVVVPVWTAQPWYPLFSSLLITPPIIFHPTQHLLSFSNRPHPLWKKITLAAGILSYKP